MLRERIIRPTFAAEKQEKVICLTNQNKKTQ